MKKLLIIITCLISLGVQGQDKTLTVRRTSNGTIIGVDPSAVRDTLLKVSINGLANGDILQSSGGKWVNVALSTIVPVGLADSLAKKANRTFDNVASGAIANVKLANSTISGVALGSNLNTLTLGNGLIGTSYNGSSAVTARVDTTTIQTVANFFPKGDTRYAKLSSGFVNSITGTANQVIASASTGAVTLSLPQDIATSSTPTFAKITASGASGVQAVINATSGQFTQLDFSNGGTAKSNQYWDNTSGTMNLYSSGRHNIIKAGSGTTLNIDNNTQFTQLDFSNNGTAKGNIYLDNNNSTLNHFAAGGHNFAQNITAPTIKLTSGAGAGLFLKSDASGNASWQSSGATTYKGAWNASTNTPTLADGVGTIGDMYAVSTGGTQFSRTFVAGGFAIYNGSIWEPVGTTASVSSVNSLTGSVQINPSISGDVISLTGGTTTADISGATSIVNKLPLSGGTLSGALNGTTATFSGNVQGSSLIAEKAGSNTVGAGPYLQLGSTSNNRFWIDQMNGSFNRDFWYYDGSSWAVKQTLSPAGDLTLQGIVTAPSFSGSLSGNASTATSLQTARNIQGVSFNGTADINPINGTGLVKATGTTLSYDNTTYAPLNSPALTGTPTAPTATAGTNTTQIATTAFVQAAVGSSGLYSGVITAGSNVSGSSYASNTTHYTRVGNQVTVYGRASITATTASTGGNFYIDLPIASNLTTGGDLDGVATSSGGYTNMVIYEDSTGDRAQVEFVSAPGTQSPVQVFYSFTYTVK